MALFSRNRHTWLYASEELPAEGERILCLFKQGTTWSGNYHAGQAFVRWFPIDLPDDFIKESP